MITIDWSTFILSIPQSYLTLVSGTFYTVDTNQMRLDFKDIEYSEDGIAFSDITRHNTEVTVAGTTYARTIEALSPYSLQFENLQMSVRLEGSNNNFFDIQNGILVQNQVQVIPTNSAGLIVRTETTGSGLSTEQDQKLTDIHSKLPSDGEEIAGENDVSSGGGGGSSPWSTAEKDQLIADMEVTKRQSIKTANNTTTE